MLPGRTYIKEKYVTTISLPTRKYVGKRFSGPHQLHGTRYGCKRVTSAKADFAFGQNDKQIRLVLRLSNMTINYVLVRAVIVRQWTNASRAASLWASSGDSGELPKHTVNGVVESSVIHW